MTTALITQRFDAFERAALAVIDAKRSEHTRDAYRRDLDRWLRFCGTHDVDPCRVPLAAATMFRAELIALVSNASAQRVLASMSGVYRVLLTGGGVTTNPFHPSVLAWPKLSGVNHTALVSDETAQAMIAACEAEMTGSGAEKAWRGARDAAILRLLYDTGLRRESVASIRRENIRGAALYVVVKGGAEVETQLPEVTQRAIARWLAVAWSSPFLFPGEVHASHIHVKSINYIVKRRGATVGAPDVHPHCFRAAWATSAYNAGLPEYEIQAGMHHKDPATTRRYDRGARGLTAADKVAEFRNQRKPQ